MTAMAAPALWRPALSLPALPTWRDLRRRLPRWRPPLLHPLRHAADGHLLFGPAGHLVHTCGTPTHCGGACFSAPVSLTAAFSGTTCCPGCLGALSKQNTTISSFSGTYTIPFLAEDPSGCGYSLTTGGSGFDFYQFNNCGGSVVSSGDTLTISTGIIRVAGVNYINGLRADISGPDSTMSAFFFGGAQVITDCTTGVTIANATTGACGGTGSSSCRGGSCLLTFNY